MMNTPIKVLHAPSMVGGNPIRLAFAEKKLGLNSFCVSIVQTKFKYDVDLILETGSRVKTLWNIFYWALFKTKNFDVIHYNFGESLLPSRPYSPTDNGFYKRIKFLLYSLVELFDLKLNFLRGKVIVVTYQGDDARQGDFCKKNYPIHFAHHVSPDYYPELLDTWKRQRIEFVDKYSDIIYALNPDLLRVLPKKAKFLPYAGVNMDDWMPSWPSDGVDFVPHVIHAPSHQKVKGTEYVIEAVEKLKKEGINFKFTLIEGLSNTEARKIYESADLLVDQLLAGFYGGLSVELMALGKPSICYLREEDLDMLPSTMKEDIPIINASPETIYTVLKNWLTTDKNKIRNLGFKSRSFVEKWHDPIKVAKIVKNDYEKFLEKKK